VRLQLPTGQIKMQRLKAVFVQKQLLPKVATPHGSDKNATKGGTAMSSKAFFKPVATPHGSDKNATFFNPQFFNPRICRMLQLPTGQIKMQPQSQDMQSISKICVATPHGSDKNATFSIRLNRFFSLSCNSPRVR